MNITEQDVVICFGFASFLPEISVLLEHSKEVNYQLILINDHIASKNSANINIVLYAARGELWDFHSMITPILIIESLVVALAKKNPSSIEKLEYLHALRKKYNKYLPK